MVSNGAGASAAHAAPAGGIAVELSDVSKRFGDFTAVDRLSLRVARGELVALDTPANLKRTFGDTVIAMETASPVSAALLGRLRALPGVREANQENGVLRVTMTGEQQVTGQVVTLVTQETTAAQATTLLQQGRIVAIGAATRRFQRVTALGIPLAFYLFFLSGGISVAAFLSNWVQTIAHVIPTFYGVHALQMSVFYGSTDGYLRDAAVMAGTACVTLALGVFSRRRRTLV